MSVIRNPTCAQGQGSWRSEKLVTHVHHSRYSPLSTVSGHIANSLRCSHKRPSNQGSSYIQTLAKRVTTAAISIAASVTILASSPPEVLASGQQSQPQALFSTNDPIQQQEPADTAPSPQSTSSTSSTFSFASAPSIVTCQSGMSCVSTSSFLSPAQYLAPWSFDPASPDAAMQ